MTKARLEDLILGESSTMRDLRDAIRRAAILDGPVLIKGPTGAGKELVANGLHAESGRRGKFVACNAAAIPEGLFESEVMGHVRGAFTGAMRDRLGLLRLADHGTVFLDEIGDLYASAQAKLLRVLDTHEVWSVGADSSRYVDFRFVAATNVDLSRAMQLGRFREDLLFRLDGLVIHVPALRDHPTDIGQLAAHFANLVTAEAKAATVVFTDSAIERLEQHDWPGNVRELRRTIEHIVFEANGSTITEDKVVRALNRGDNPHAGSRRHPSHLSHRRELLALLATHMGDIRAVARALGITRSSAYRRMHRLGIPVPSRGPRLRGPVNGNSELDATM